MTKREKRLERIRQNPKTVSFEELRWVLEDHGFVLTRTTGSHHHFRAEVDDMVYHLSVLYRRPFIQVVYVKRVLEVLEELIAQLPETQEGTNDNP